MTLSSRIRIGILALVAAAFVTFVPAYLGYQLARGDEGSAMVDAGVVVDAGTATPAPPAADPAPDDIARDIYRGITGKDWFLVAGGVLSFVVLGVRWLLAKKWPKVEGDWYGVLLVAALAGFGALGNAWIADERLASTTTLLGAVKTWAVAVWGYVTTKKLLESLAARKAAS